LELWRCRVLTGRPALFLLVFSLLGCLAFVPHDDPPNASPSAIPTPAQELATPAPTARGVAEAGPAAAPLTCRLADPRSTSSSDVTADENVRLSSPASVPPPDPLRPADFLPDSQLEQSIRSLLGDDAGSYAVVIKNLQTGRGASINAGRIFYAASIFKLFVMYEVFHQQSLGLLDLADELVMTPYYDSYGLGPRETSLCERLSVSEALNAMMSVSDNAAAVLLQDSVGSGNINQSLAALGLADSRLLLDDLPLTAADVALLLEGIGRGEAVSIGASDQMIALMEAEEFDNGLRAGLPASATLAHKTGNWDNATHEAGLVFAPCGTYAIVVLSDLGWNTLLTSQIGAVAYAYCQGL
jgi:beta-lactamase class A